jgi:hypothetical protein
MSTLKAINLVHPTSATNNIVLDNAGNMTAGGTLAMSSSFMRNRIINGAMVIDQRNAGASVTPTGDGVYTLDRWQVSLSAASKFSLQQSSTAPTGFSYSTLITSLSAYSVPSGGYFMFNQPVEGYNMADFGWGTASAKTVTISFWVNSSLTGTFGGAIQNNAQNRAYPFSYTISAANTWEQKSVTIAGDTSGTWLTTNGVGMYLRFGLGVGSTFSTTAGAWTAGQYFAPTGATSVVGTNGATFYITGVQLEVGTVATPFERRQYGTEFMLCQRYFISSYNPGTAVGTATGDATGPLLQVGTTANSNSPFFPTVYPVTMRTSPTVTTYSPNTGASGKIRKRASPQSDVNSALFRNTATCGTFGPNGTGGTTDEYECHFTASAEL